MWSIPSAGRIFILCKAAMTDRVMPCVIYSRIVGYLRPVQYWNEAKQLEFADRVDFKVKGGAFPMPSENKKDVQLED